MKTLKDYIKESLKINESGNAVTAEPVPAYITPLVYKDIEDDIKKYDSSLKICPLGSLGKKNDDQFNGDIDIAIEISDKKTLVDMLKEVFPDCELNPNTTNDIASIGYKWSKEGKSGTAQVDFMITKNIEWAKWRWSSPDFRKGESKYKGQAKDWVLRCITHAIPPKEAVEYFEDGKTVKRRWRVVFNFEGVYDRLVNYIGKTGKPVAKETKEIEQLAANDPQNVMTFCLGKDAKAEDFVKGAEHLWRRAHEIWPWGDDALKEFEDDFYDNYIHGPKGKGIDLKEEDFPRKF